MSTDLHSAAVANLAAEVDDEHGWLSDAQYAQLEWDEDNQSISFCGEGSIDVGHLVSIVLGAVERVRYPPTPKKEQ